MALRAALGNLLYGPGSGEATRWTAARTEDLEAGEVECLVATLERLRKRLAADQEAVRKAIGHFQANTNIALRCAERSGRWEEFWKARAVG